MRGSPAPATRLRRAQAANGGFRSIVRGHGHEREDTNGLTALVLRALRGAVGERSRAESVIGRALDFLERLEAPAQPGAYGFWSTGERPAWAPSLPPDADDTAIIALELARAGRLGHSDLVHILCDVLLPHRVRKIDARTPPWIRRGAFQTWLAKQSGRRNIVDCCVNANVLALMGYAGMIDLPGYEAACATVEAGLLWAGSSPARLRVLTPFYPHPRELLEALRHAAENGVARLAQPAKALERIVQTLPAQAGLHPICSSAYGQTVWYAPILARVRGLRGFAE